MGAKAEDTDSCTVMDRYVVSGIESGDAFLGEGAFSMVWLARDSQTGKKVALKTYKADLADEEEQKLVHCKFKRQIEVLQHLQQPLERGNTCNEAMWEQSLGKTTSQAIFLQLVDYSKNEKGEPGPYTDGSCYVITEMADYSLKDFIRQRREGKKPLSQYEVQSIAHGVMLSVAGLHSKGLVHLDFKAENLMWADQNWKLIDLDGAVKADMQLSIDDSTISFSPAYCSPEFANFMLGEQEYLRIKPSMDVWSVGLTICELVLLKVVISTAHNRILKANNLNSGQAIIEWLIFTCPDGPLPLPPALEEFNSDFRDIAQLLLHRDPDRRWSLCQALTHSYWMTEAGPPPSPRDEKPDRPHRKDRIVGKESNRKLLPVYKGTLWKLNADGDPHNPEHWLKRDFWIAQNGGLCYFSNKQAKALIMIDGSDMRCIAARRVEAQDSAKENVFELALGGLSKENIWFAADSEDAVDEWFKAVESNRKDERRTMNVKNMRAMRLRIRNARREYDEKKSEYQKMFEGKLWKLDQEGDPKQDHNWRLREMWLAQNGSLCYFSEKQQKGLEYHSSADIKSAEVRELGTDESAKDHAFEILLPSKDGMEFDPGVFAALSTTERADWIAKLQSLKGPSESNGKKASKGARAKGRLSIVASEVKVS